MGKFFIRQWEFTRQRQSIWKKKINKIKTFDLHGYSLNEANEKIKEHKKSQNILTVTVDFVS